MKKLLSILLALVMALSLGVMAFAADVEDESSTDAVPTPIAEETVCETCESVEDALKELLGYVNSDEFKGTMEDLKNKVEDLIENSDDVAGVVDDLFEKLEDLSGGAIDRETISKILADTGLFDWFVKLYVPAIPETTTTTTATTEPETEENIPQTGSTGAGLAVFAVLSVAAAAAYVSKKR